MIYVIVAVIIIIIFTKALCNLSKDDDDLFDEDLLKDEANEEVESKE